MLLSELYEHYGSWTQLTKELDLGLSTYTRWLKKGYIPYTSQLVIEKKTNNLFKADQKHGRPDKNSSFL
jgi:hypothetical protein